MSVELILAVIATIALGTPHKLPGAALSSMVIFHGYRALLIFGALYGVTVVLVRSFSGSLASKVGSGGLEFPAEAVASSAAQEITALNLRLSDQANLITALAVRLADGASARHETERAITDLRRIADDLRADIRRLERG